MKRIMSEIGMLLISCVLMLMSALQVDARPAGDFAKSNNITLMNGTVSNGTSLTASPTPNSKLPQRMKRSVLLSVSEQLLAAEFPVRQKRSKDPNQQPQMGSQPNITTTTSGTRSKRSPGEDDYDEEAVRHKRRAADKDYYDDYQEPPSTPAPPPPEEPQPEPEPEPTTIPPPLKPTPKSKGKRSPAEDSYEVVQARAKRSPDDDDDYGDEGGDPQPPEPPPPEEPAPAPPADPDDDYMDDSRKKRSAG